MVVRCLNRLVLAGLCSSSWRSPSLPASADTEVDLALVLAVDISYSMDPEEQALQREGFAQAFRSPLVHDAIRAACSAGSPSTYMNGPAPTTRRSSCPGRSSTIPESILAFARQDRLDAPAAGAADLDLGRHRLRREAARGERRRGDAAGDRRLRRRPEQPGPARHAGARRGRRQGHHHQRPADHAAPAGLPRYPGPRRLLTGTASSAAQGAFMVPVREREQFLQAIKTKILLEIAGLEPQRTR